MGTIYRNLTPNITKGQKRVKKGSKIGKKIVKIKNAYRNTIFECIFGMFTQFINAHMTIYRNLTTNRNKGQKRVKKGSKIVKNLKKLIEIPFFHNFLYNTHKPDRIHYFNHAHMTIYRNLTPNINKGQKRVQNWSEMVKIKKKTHRKKS